MSNWIEVEADKLMTPRMEKIRGVDVQVFVSPHDTPRKIRGRFDESADRFVIELKYIDDEKWDLVQHSDDSILTLYVGQDSGRIGRIEVDVRKADAKKVTLRIDALKTAEAELSNMTGRQRSLSARLNFQAAREAIAYSEDQLTLA